MSTEFNRWVQQRLNVHGAKLIADGVIGPLSRQAIEEFQMGKGLAMTATTTAETVKALRLDPNGAVSKPAIVKVGIPWLEEARRRAGLHEVKDYNVLMKWFASDGHALGDIRKLPWCGEFVETAIRTTLPDEPIPSNPYWARNWMQFGKPTTGREGAIAVFSRTGGGGHVAFYVGEDATAYRVFGGNQSDRVCETWVAKSRLLGFRWPTTFNLDTRAVSLAANGALSTNEA